MVFFGMTPQLHCIAPQQQQSLQIVSFSSFILLAVFQLLGTKVCAEDFLQNDVILKA